MARYRRKLTRPDVFMTQTPTFEKVCALVIWALGQDTLPERVRVQFEDIDGDPPDTMPDIDVREHYPKGSSAFEQMVVQFQGDEVADFASLTAALNRNNATGYLKEGLFQRWSLVRLIRKLYGIWNPEGFTVKSWRQKVIKRFLPVAQTAILFSLVSKECDTAAKRLEFHEAFPNIARMGPLAPFTLPGYAYAQWLMWPMGFQKFLDNEFRAWLNRFEEVHEFRARRKAQLESERIPLYVCPSTGTRILCLDVKTDQDANIALRIYPKADIIVALDGRSKIPRVAILPRESRPILREMHAIHMAFAEWEPGAWYAMPRESGFSYLLNGSISRAAKVPSQFARNEPTMMGAILVALENWHQRHSSKTEP